METRYNFNSKIDDLAISALRIEPDNKQDIKGIVQLVHGMCEYKERYLDFMNYLAGNGYICVIHDHRGHGESIKQNSDLGYMYEGGYKALIEDTHTLTVMTKRYAKKLTGRDLPFILLGHSMGSLVVRCYVKKYDYEIDKLLVLGCPSEQPGAKPGLAFIKLVSKLKGERSHSGIIDNLVMNSRYEKRFKSEKLKHAWLNSNPKEVERYNADPFCNFTFTLNGYVNLVKLNIETYDTTGYVMRNEKMPIKFFAGSDDPCGISKKDFVKAMRLMKQAGYENVKGKLYDGMRHEILKEPDYKTVYSDILKFIELDKTSASTSEE